MNTTRALFKIVLVSLFATRAFASDQPTVPEFPAAGSRWLVLPDGLLYAPQIANPKEPRISQVFSYDRSRGEWIFDPTLGGRVGLFRIGEPGLRADGWQVDIEGGVMPRLDASQSLDLESADYRFGLHLTRRSGRLSYRAGYFHISSHVGDEYLLRTPGFPRINFVQESLIAGVSFEPSEASRVYGDVAWAFARRGGAKAWQLRAGLEISPRARSPRVGAPFAAVHGNLRQEVNFDPSINVAAGWQWIGPDSGRSFRTGLQYLMGPTTQYQFLGRHDRQLGFGVWLDY